MIYYSTFIVIYEDTDLPEVEFFCPSLWEIEDIKITGDYYYTNAERRWNMLDLIKRDKEEMYMGFALDIYRKESLISKTMEVDALKEYVRQFENNWFAHDHFKTIKIPAVAQLTFVSDSLQEYEDFLDTTYRFLEHTSGCIINVLAQEYDAAEFHSLFIENKFSYKQES